MWGASLLVLSPLQLKKTFPHCVSFNRALFVAPAAVSRLRSAIACTIQCITSPDCPNLLLKVRKKAGEAEKLQRRELSLSLSRSGLSWPSSRQCSSVESVMDDFLHHETKNITLHCSCDHWERTTRLCPKNTHPTSQRGPCSF